MASRLCQKSVYAFRFFPEEGSTHPGAERIVVAVRSATQRVVADSRPGSTDPGVYPLFVGSDPVISWEASDQRIVDGFIATGTPLLHAAVQVLIALRAHEKIFAKAVQAAETELRKAGHPGHIGLAKVPLDAFGRHRAGRDHRTLERYETTVATGVWLRIYQLGVLVFIAWFALWSLLTQGLEMLVVALVGVMAGVACAGLFVLHRLLLFIAYQATQCIGSKRFRCLVPLLRGGHKLYGMLAQQFVRPTLASTFHVARLAARLPMMLTASLPCLWFLRWTSFRPHRRVLPAFLVSRTILAGCGVLQADGRFELDPSRPLAWWYRLIDADDGPLGGSTLELLRRIIGAAEGLWHGEFFRCANVLRPQQFLVLPLSSGNRAHLADYLRLATTRWMIDLVDAGVLREAPRFVNAAQAHQQILADPSLSQSVALLKAAPATALQLQHWYVTRAHAWLTAQPATNLESHKLLRLWTDTLRELSEDPGRLVGRLDWVTKRYLIEAAAKHGSLNDQKRVDLRYHELVSGYFEWLEREGVAMSLISPDDIERTVAEPERVLRLSMLTCPREGIAYQGERVPVRWDAARIGTWWRPRLVPLTPS